MVSCGSTGSSAGCYPEANLPCSVCHAVIEMRWWDGVQYLRMSAHATKWIASRCRCVQQQAGSRAKTCIQCAIAIFLHLTLALSRKLQIISGYPFCSDSCPNHALADNAVFRNPSVPESIGTPTSALKPIPPLPTKSRSFCSKFANSFGTSIPQTTSVFYVNLFCLRNGNNALF